MGRPYKDEEPASPQRSHNFFSALLFPANLTGLAHIGIYTVCFLALSFIQRMMISNMAIRMGFGILGFIVTIEMVNYLYHCIRESASGATAAPDSLLLDSFDTGGVSATFGGYFSLQAEYLGVIFPVVICFVPALLYPLFTERFDMTFIVLLAVGAFYYPMLQTAAVLFDSSTGYNPFIHIISIIKTFFSYCLLVIETALILAGFCWLVYLFQNSIIGAIVLFPILMYALMVMMHLLGRFYFLHQATLDWEV